MNASIKFFLTLFLVTLVSACNSEKKIAFIKEPTLVSNPESSAPLTCYIDFETKQEIREVIFSLKDSDSVSKLRYTPADKKKSGYLLMLMKPDREYKIGLEFRDRNRNTFLYEKELHFKTPPLPADDKEFPLIQITNSSTDEMEEGFTLFNPRRRVPLNTPGANALNTAFGMLAMVNHQGEVVWYYRTDSRISDFDLLPNGNLSYMTQDSRIAEIDFGGNIVQEWYAANRPEGKDERATPVNTLTLHHDVSLLPNGNRLALSTEEREIKDYYTSEYDEKAPRKTQMVMGDVIVEFTPQGDIVHQWKTFDYLPVKRIGYETFSRYWERRGFPGTIDWSHANAIVPLPEENAYLINYRYQSAMIKVDKTSGQIKWIFAEPTGWGSTLQDKLLKLAGEDWPWHQHSPRFTANGNLLFFNNNNYRARPFEAPQDMTDCPSYVVEYKIDEENRTVEKIWTSQIPDEPTIISIAMGRVSELPETGNILAAFGAILSPEHLEQMTWKNRAGFPQWTMVREYKHSTPAQIVWEMRILPRTEESVVGWTLFGAERIEIKQFKKVREDL